MINFFATKTNYKLQFKIEIKKLKNLIDFIKHDIYLSKYQLQLLLLFVILNIIIIIPFHLLPYQHQVENIVKQFLIMLIIHPVHIMLIIIIKIILVFVVYHSVVNYCLLKIKIVMK